VAVLAVDPSSKVSGGALLGDRARIAYDPGDRGVFIRSTAAGGRLGGLAPSTRAAAQALAAAFDVVVIETVGVGQSETEVAEVAEALDAHRAGLDLAARRLAARRAGALADFAAEHGDRGLRALGGRRAAERVLAEQDPGADVASLVEALEARAAEAAS